MLEVIVRIVVHQEAVIAGFLRCEAKVVFLHLLHFHGFANGNRGGRNNTNSTAVTQTAAGRDGNFRLTRGNGDELVVVIQTQHVWVGRSPGHILPNAVSGHKGSICIVCFTDSHFLRAVFHLNALGCLGAHHPDICTLCTITQLDAEYNPTVFIHIQMPSVICAVYTFYTPGRSNVKIDCCIFICQNTIIAILRRSKGKDVCLPLLNFNGITHRNCRSLNNLYSAADAQPAFSGSGYLNLAFSQRINTGAELIAVQFQHFRIGASPSQLSQKAISGYGGNIKSKTFTNAYLLRTVLQLNSFRSNAALYPNIHISLA